MTAAERYDPGMTSRVAKITVSLPLEQVEAVRRAVSEGRAASVSAYVSEALAAAGATESLRSMVDDWIAEDGVPSEEARAWAAEGIARALRLQQT